MFTPAEDLVLQSGPVWHGTALGWKKSADKLITKLPIISDRFCGVNYVDKGVGIDMIAFTAYLPTSGKDEEFLEILSMLSFDIAQHKTDDSIILIGTDSNVSIQGHPKLKKIKFL